MTAGVVCSPRMRQFRQRRNVPGRRGRFSMIDSISFLVNFRIDFELSFSPVKFLFDDSRV